MKMWYYDDDYYFFRPLAQNRFKYFTCTKQGMTAAASNRSQKCWGRRPRFPFGGLLTTAETERWIIVIIIIIIIITLECG